MVRIQFFLTQLGIWFMASYFITLHKAYNAGAFFEQASRVKCVNFLMHSTKRYLNGHS